MVMEKRMTKDRVTAKRKRTGGRDCGTGPPERLKQREGCRQRYQEGQRCTEKRERRRQGQDIPAPCTGRGPTSEGTHTNAGPL